MKIFVTKLEINFLHTTLTCFNFFYLFHPYQQVNYMPSLLSILRNNIICHFELIIRWIRIYREVCNGSFLHKQRGNWRKIMCKMWFIGNDQKGQKIRNVDNMICLETMLKYSSLGAAKHAMVNAANILSYRIA